MVCANILLTVLAAANVVLALTWPNIWAVAGVNALIVVVAWTIVVCKPCMKQPTTKRK